MNNDDYFIRKTFILAKKARGFTSPNPMVGAVIVKDKRIISCGYHRKAGQVHAEIDAIEKAKVSLKGATLYINLEPCFHWGRTPPCVDRIISSGIKEVIVATSDPNPKVKGRSINKLRREGIGVKVGTLKKQARRLNEIFFKNMESRQAFVAVKLAQSLDGSIATRLGHSKWITSKKARSLSRALRDEYDAVLVGANTVINDNPALRGRRKNPYRIVIDPQLSIPKGCTLIRKQSDKLIIFFTSRAKRSHLKALSKTKAKLIKLKEKGGFIPLRQILRICYRLNIMSIFVEGGSLTAGRFFDEKIVDKIYWFVAPKIIGGRGALRSVGSKGAGVLNNACRVEDIEIVKIGQDFLITGYPKFKHR